MIYHIAVEADFRTGLTDTLYTPADLARDGFVHCADEGVVLAVADDYFAGAEGSVLLLAIEPARLTAELRVEAPAPLPGGGRQHLEAAARFPHVYGPIDRDAIDGVGKLERSAAGFRWPARLVPLSAFLAGTG